MAPQRGGDLKRLGELIQDIRIALLTTVDFEGGPHTRPVETLSYEPTRSPP